MTGAPRCPSCGSQLGTHFGTGIYVYHSHDLVDVVPCHSRREAAAEVAQLNATITAGDMVGVVVRMVTSRTGEAGRVTHYTVEKP